MGTHLIWIILGILNIFSNTLQKYMAEDKQKSAYWWGVSTGVWFCVILIHFLKIFGA